MRLPSLKITSNLISPFQSLHNTHKSAFVGSPLFENPIPTQSIKNTFISKQAFQNIAFTYIARQLLQWGKIYIYNSALYKREKSRCMKVGILLWQCFHPIANSTRVSTNKVKSKQPFIYFNHFRILSHTMLITQNHQTSAAL